MWYEWECVRGDCSNVKAKPSDRRLFSRVLELTGLVPGTEYMFNIHAKNDVSYFTYFGPERKTLDF